jgi:hypothetical protein
VVTAEVERSLRVDPWDSNPTGGDFTTALNLLVVATEPRRRDRFVLCTGVTGHWFKKLDCGVRGLWCLGIDWLCGELVADGSRGCEVRYAERVRPECRGFALR